MENIRKICFDALLKTATEDAYSNVVASSLAKRKYEDKRNKAFVCALYYGIIEREITLDYIISLFSRLKPAKIDIKAKILLRMGIYQIVYMDKVPDSAAVNETVKLCPKIGMYSAKGFINGVLRNVAREKDNIKYPKPGSEEYLSVMYSCHIDKVRLIVKSYGYELCEEYLKCSMGSPVLTARVNTLLTNSDEIIKILADENIVAEKNSVVDNAIDITDGADNLFSSKAFDNGLLHIQDAASQICCRAIGAKENDLVYDVCAAPGGKTATVAQIMNNKGRVIACDIHEHKLGLMNETFSRLKINIIDTICRDASHNDGKLTAEADAILCDVPCSGLGIFRRKPELKTKPLINTKELAKLQYKILCESAKLLRSGGTLVYSTCTLNPEENSENALRFLKEHPEFEPKRLEIKNIKRIVDEPDNMITLFPNGMKTDGFFISAFIKK